MMQFNNHISSRKTLQNAASKASLMELVKQNNWLARDINREPTSKTGPLAGREFFAKDLFAIEDEVTRCGSRIFDEDPPAKSDAALITKARSLGARLIGTTNMDALAYGFVSNNPLYGLAKNPIDTMRICGGSSGGSAAVVAAGLADFAFGTDTSGSIRVPSALCGVAGYKPSADVFNNAGIGRLSPTFDRPGLFARDAKLLREIAVALAQPGQLLEVKSTPPKVGMLGGYFVDQLDLVIEQAVDSFAAETAARTGLEVSNVKAARAAAYILVADEAAQIFAEKLRKKHDLFDIETRNRLAAASLIQNSWRENARRTQRDFTYQFNRLFEDFDVLIAPSVPMIAPHRSKLANDNQNNNPPLRASLGVFTQPISITGCPAVNVPLETSAGLPTAVQLIGPVGSDAMLLSYAAELGR